MSPLRERLTGDLKLAGYAKRTQESYLSVVVNLSKYYNRSPDQLTEEELRTFFLSLKTRQLSDSTFKQYATGIKFFYEKTLSRQWTLFDLVRPAKSRKLPFALSHEEVKKLLTLVRVEDCRMAVTLIYSCGLRLNECIFLRIRDIDGNRKRLRVIQGKGKRDREIPIPERTLELLRYYWSQHRPSDYLFPSPLLPDKPMHATRLQRVFKTVVRDSGTAHQQTSIHTLRHSYATHLLENGINLKQLMELLGHRSISTTLRYTHLTTRQNKDVVETINHLMSDL